MNRHSRSVFLLMELLLTFLIFCFCASVILQVFSKGVTISRRVEDTTSALLRAESIAEEIKAGDGSESQLEGMFYQRENENTFVIYYDKEWNRIEDESDFIATVTVTQLAGQILSVEIVMSARDETLATVSMQHYYPNLEVAV